MSLFISSLNSGSNGNAYYVGNAHEAVLIDAGLSCRKLEQRMERLELPMEKIRAVFISHEHVDHISAIKTLSKKYQIPVYITEGTLESSRLKLDPRLLRSFGHSDVIRLGGLSITAFSKYHDAADPFSFMVEGNGIKISVITDIGRACQEVVRYFKQSHAAFLEANYDEDMLENGPYPRYLKERIRGGHGHLSNKQALELFLEHRPPFMSHLILSHLSKTNNSPELVAELFKTHSAETQVIVASRYEESPVYHISASGENPGMRKSKKELRASQLSLF